MQCEVQQYNAVSVVLLVQLVMLMVLVQLVGAVADAASTVWRCLPIILTIAQDRHTFCTNPCTLSKCTVRALSAHSTHALVRHVLNLLNIQLRNSHKTGVFVKAIDVRERCSVCQRDVGALVDAGADFEWASMSACQQRTQKIRTRETKSAACCERASSKQQRQWRTGVHGRSWR